MDAGEARRALATFASLGFRKVGQVTKHAGRVELGHVGT
jgi:hypothetical protein